MYVTSQIQRKIDISPNKADQMLIRLKYEDYMNSIGAPFEPFDISTLPSIEQRRSLEEQGFDDETGQASDFADEGAPTRQPVEHSSSALLDQKVSLKTGLVYHLLVQAPFGVIMSPDASKFINKCQSNLIQDSKFSPGTRPFEFR